MDTGRGIGDLGPTRLAALLAGGYALLAGCYIWVSGELSARFAEDLGRLQQIETIKGMLYVLITALALFAAARWLLGRLAKGAAALASQRMALLESERRGIAGTMAGALAHDINNMLTVVNGVGHALSEHSSPEQVRRHAERLREASTQIQALARQLVQTGRQEPPEDRQARELKPLIEQTVDFLRHHRAVKSCRVELELSALEAPVAPLAFQQLIFNLVLNAAHATAGRGVVQLRLYPENEQVVLEVHDDGPGVPEDQRQTIFEPFVSGQEGGHGLGLVSVRHGVELHGGSIEVLDSPLGGALFRIRLPSRK